MGSEQSSPADIEAQTVPGDHSNTGANAVQIAALSPEAAMTLVAQVVLSVTTKTLGPIDQSIVQGPLFKVYTAANLTTFIIDFVLISYLVLILLSSKLITVPIPLRMAVVKALVFVALLLSFSFPSSLALPSCSPFDRGFSTTSNKTNQMNRGEILQRSPSHDIEAQMEAGELSGESAVQVATTPPDAAATLIAQVTLSVATKTLGPMHNIAQDPVFKVYTVTNLTVFIIDLILISYFALTLLSSAVRPTAQRMAVLKALIWAAMVLSFISFLLGSSLLLLV